MSKMLIQVIFMAAVGQFWNFIKESFIFSKLYCTYYMFIKPVEEYYLEIAH